MRVAVSPWPLEAYFFFGTACVQVLLAGALIARHNRQEWAWVLVVLFAFNGVVALARGAFYGPTPVCGDPCRPLGTIQWLWFEPPTAPLLAYFLLIYPEPPRWVQRHAWAARGIVLGPAVAHWGLVVLAKPMFGHPVPFYDWRDGILVLDRLGVPAMAWCIILLRGAWIVTHLDAPLRHRPASLVCGVAAMRAVHVVLLQAFGFLQDRFGMGPGTAELGSGGVVVWSVFLGAPLACAGVAVAMLVRARRSLPLPVARNAGIALWFIAAGVFLTFLPGARRLRVDPGWDTLLTGFDVHVARPVVVWLALVRPRFASIMGREHDWSVWVAAAYTAVGAYTATSSAFRDAGLGVVYLHGMSAFAAGSMALLVVGLDRFLATSGAGSPLGTPVQRRKARRLEAYAAALESGWPRPAPDPPTRERFARLRRRLRVSMHEHHVLARAVRDPGPPAGAEWQPGDVLLSRYEVIALLGQGGAGETYRCRDILAGRDVVLKRAHRLDAASRRALAVEALALSRVSSQHILPCRGVETVGGAIVLVLDLMPGGSLQDRLARDGPLSAREAVAVATDLLRGLEAAHRAGIVHGDVKPSNILFDRRDRAVLADFGAARAAPGAAGLADPTQPGVPLGSLRYMSPEQVKGLPADPRTDLYALAVVLSQAVSGVHPLGEPASDLDARQAIARGDVRPPAGLPAPLRRVLARALSVEPGLRPPSARSMAAALRKAASGARRPAAAHGTRSRRRLRPTPMTSPA